MLRVVLQPDKWLDRPRQHALLPDPNLPDQRHPLGVPPRVHMRVAPELRFDVAPGATRRLCNIDWSSEPRRLALDDHYMVPPPVLQHQIGPAADRDTADEQVRRLKRNVRSVIYKVDLLVRGGTNQLVRDARLDPLDLAMVDLTKP